MSREISKETKKCMEDIDKFYEMLTIDELAKQMAIAWFLDNNYHKKYRRCKCCGDIDEIAVFADKMCPSCRKDKKRRLEAMKMMNN